MAYAAVILRDDRVMRKWTGILTERHDTAVSEIIASTKACAEIPDGSRVVVYTDIDWLVEHFRAAQLRNKFRYIHLSADELAESCERFEDAIVRRVNRQNPHYQWCHSEARRATRHAKRLVRYV